MRRSEPSLSLLAREMPPDEGRLVGCGSIEWPHKLQVETREFNFLYLNLPLQVKMISDELVKEHTLMPRLVVAVLSKYFVAGFGWDLSGHLRNSFSIAQPAFDKVPLWRGAEVQSITVRENRMGVGLPKPNKAGRGWTRS